MKTKLVKFEDATYEKQWIITKWYEKTAYVIGVIMGVWMAFWFFIGAIAELIKSL